MMSARVVLVFVALALPVQAQTSAESKAAAAAYFECMDAAARQYARVASTADEAIEAAKSKCKVERNAAITQVAADRVLFDESRGVQSSADDAVISAQGVMASVDSKKRPDWVRAVLDSK